MTVVQRYLIIVLAYVLVPQIASAMYKCVDDNGNTTFTDVAISESCLTMDLGEDIQVHVRDGSSFRIGGQLRSYNKKAKNTYDKYINFYGVRYNIDPHLIRAMIRTESGFNPKAVSKKGARGLMQLMPGTAKELKVDDVFDPKQNIEGGTRYLRSLLDTFKEDLKLALAAYNAGPTVVKKQMKVPRIPETVNYVKQVLKYYQEYKTANS